MNKQKLLEEAREIKATLELDRFLRIGNRIYSLKRNFQKIKDQWEEGCGKAYFHPVWGQRICGGFEDLKHIDHIIVCQECINQNKEFKQICEVVGI